MEAPLILLCTAPAIDGRQLRDMRAFGQDRLVLDGPAPLTLRDDDWIDRLAINAKRHLLEIGLANDFRADSDFAARRYRAVKGPRILDRRTARLGHEPREDRDDPDGEDSEYESQRRRRLLQLNLPVRDCRLLFRGPASLVDKERNGLGKAIV